MEKEQENHLNIQKDRRAPGEAKSSHIWFGLIAGPVVWAAHFTLTYALASTACQSGFLVDRTLFGINALTATLILITIVALAIMIYAAFLSHRNWQILRSHNDPHLIGVPEENRHRFMAFSGLALNIIFMVSVILSILPSFFFNPCQ
jgi:hypothetical protein